VAFSSWVSSPTHPHAQHRGQWHPSSYTTQQPPILSPQLSNRRSYLPRVIWEAAAPCLVAHMYAESLTRHLHLPLQHGDGRSPHPPTTLLRTRVRTDGWRAFTAWSASGWGLGWAATQGTEPACQAPPQGRRPGKTARMLSARVSQRCHSQPARDLHSARCPPLPRSSQACSPNGSIARRKHCLLGSHVPSRGQGEGRNSSA